MTGQSTDPLQNVDWNNLTPNQLMAISVKSNVEVNERISQTQEQVADVINRVDETNDLLKETIINQRHIENEVDEVKDEHKELKTHVEDEFKDVRKSIAQVAKNTAVKNTQLSLIKWIGALACTMALTWFFTAYLPNKSKTDELSEIKTFLIETFKGEANEPVQQNQP